MATRAGTYPRSQAKAAGRATARRNRWRLAFIAVLPLPVSLLLLLLWPNATLPVWPIPIALWAVALSVTWSEILGTSALEAGADAEVWTSKELGKLHGSGCEHFDHLVFENRDVDHVLVHPSGVYVLETKYTNREVDLIGRSTDSMLRDWHEQVLRSADRIRVLLVKSKKLRVDVTPVILVWGPRIEGVSKELDGVTVVKGRELMRHLQHSAPQPRLDLPKQQAVCSALRDFIARGDTVTRA